MLPGDFAISNLSCRWSSNNHCNAIVQLKWFMKSISTYQMTAHCFINVAEVWKHIGLHKGSTINDLGRVEERSKDPVWLPPWIFSSEKGRQKFSFLEKSHQFFSWRRAINFCGGHPLVKQVVTLSFNAKVDLADLTVRITHHNFSQIMCHTHGWPQQFLSPKKGLQFFFSEKAINFLSWRGNKLHTLLLLILFVEHTKTNSACRGQ